MSDQWFYLPDDWEDDDYERYIYDEEDGEVPDYEGFMDSLDENLWNDEGLLELKHLWGIEHSTFWELVHERRAAYIEENPAMTELGAVNEAITEEKTAPPDDLSDIPF